MPFTRSSIPEPYNEPMFDYAPGSKEAILLKAACDKLRNECPEIPCVVGGQEIKTGKVAKQVIPSDHQHVLCTYHQADPATLQKAVDAAAAAKDKWEALPFEDRAAVILRAADLLATKYRYEVNAATMLGQGKTVRQAEIDAAAETIDFWRFNIKFAETLYGFQPPKNSTYVWNHVEYRPLEGFVMAISPFNFTAIGANLPTSPAMMGNVVVWKPASTSILSNWLIFKILREAGLPDGVINFVPGSGREIGEHVLNQRSLAGVHFTGSTAVFNHINVQVAQNVAKGKYIGYPRVVGETGGKDFHFVHESAPVDHVVNCTMRAAFEYQGQKCSACSRMYAPNTTWPQIKQGLLEEHAKIHMGQSDDFTTFMSAVIDKNAFKSIAGYIDYAKKTPSCEIIAGGGYDDSKGYFIEPTIVVTTDPKCKLLAEEIFGPVLTIYVYDSKNLDAALKLCDETSPYALTGSIFARDRLVVEHMTRALRNAAGNFYINDRCTGSVVGQQPFGGSRASGTNDKAGSVLNLLRWVSGRSIKETFVYANEWTYPHMAGDGAAAANKVSPSSKRVKRK